jgi:predicted DNA-binding transcriptional regulator AlpA
MSKIHQADASRARAKPAIGSANRPPLYMSRKDLAWELSISESTIDELVRTGVIPPATKLTPGCVRWSWTAVEMALASLASSPDDSDPFMTGARNAIKTETEGRRGSA